MACLLLFCFTTFGKILTQRKRRQADISASSVTRQTGLGRRKRKGPPPSSDLRPIDVNRMALNEDAPDDIKMMLRMSGKQPAAGTEGRATASRKTVSNSKSTTTLFSARAAL